MNEAGGDITHLLIAWRKGESQALEQLVPLLYQDLRRIAQREIGRGAGNETLNTTGLVHEAYLRLVDQSRASWQDRNHFLGVAAIAMRQVVIAYARKRQAAKRGGGKRPLPLEDQEGEADRQVDWLLSVNEAVESLARHNERLAKVVECRFFAGLSVQETADALNISLRSVQRDWMRAKAWLKEELREHRGLDSFE